MKIPEGIYKYVDFISTRGAYIRTSYYREGVEWDISLLYEHIYVGDDLSVIKFLDWGVNSGFFHVHEYNGKFSAIPYYVEMTEKFYRKFVIPKISEMRMDHWLSILIADLGCKK